MSILYVILGILYILGCAAVVAAILLQKKRSAGMGGSVAGMGDVSKTYWDKNKGRTMEGTLEKWTKIGAVLLALFAVVLCLV
jgi:preprotein translocase subunit SecG